MVVKVTNHPSSKMCPFDMENVAPLDNPDFSRREILKVARQPATLLRSVFASAIIWLIVASLVPSYSRLLFQGKLAGYFAAGLSHEALLQMETANPQLASAVDDQPGD